MNKKAEKPEPPKKSLLFVIEDVAKLLRTEVKKTESKFSKSAKSITPDFVNRFEQIAKLLRTQVRQVQPKKKRTWNLMRKAPKPEK